MRVFFLSSFIVIVCFFAFLYFLNIIICWWCVASLRTAVHYSTHTRGYLHVYLPAGDDYDDDEDEDDDNVPLPPLLLLAHCGCR